MPQGLIKTLCFVSAVITTPMIGCSTTQGPVRKRARIEVCVPDPRNDALQCALADGSAQTRPFQNLQDGGYVCFPVDPITKILEDQ